jgi:hypothetical protein
MNETEEAHPTRITDLIQNAFSTGNIKILLNRKNFLKSLNLSLMIKDHLVVFETGKYYNDGDIKKPTKFLKSSNFQ